MSPRHLFKAFATTMGLVALLALGACDRKPSTPPLPTSASGSTRSGEYPAGIVPAGSGDKVDSTSTHKGPSEGGTAIGGMTSGQAATSGNGGAAAPTGGDGKAK
ncbi:hypothetical protein [Variovorax sp. PAMC28562]|uniref:hypothetical protein n=1 Tax=Variovorax sp. PAMC28562 TaxID=2762323 RepID=UPI0021C38C1C|nr:hypothetical protein [Variovorax sp. PAMC28562]